MASSLAQSTQRLLDAQPLLPLDLSYSTLYGLYTGANVFNCPLSYPAAPSLALKAELTQDAENRVPPLGPFSTLDQALNVVTSSATAATTGPHPLSFLDCAGSAATAAHTSSSHTLASSACDSDGSSSTVSTGCRKASGVEKRKKELIRDAAYFERRKKNNDAAKRSRDSRRRKEDEVAMRALLLEQENERLQFEVNRLRAEIERHRAVALNPKLCLPEAFDWERRLQPATP